MNNKIIDGMKKESKYCLIFSAVVLILILLLIPYIYLNNKNLMDKNVLVMFIGYLMFLFFGLYGWLYAFTYKVEFNNEKINLRTLFRKKELNVCDIEKYTCKRYRKSVFYQFDLFINGKKTLTNTRYKDEFENILKLKGLRQ